MLNTLCYTESACALVAVYGYGSSWSRGFAPIFEAMCISGKLFC